MRKAGIVHLFVLGVAVHALVWLPIAPVARAEVEDRPDFHPAVRKGIDLYNSLDYEGARAVFTGALRISGLKTDDMRNAYLYLGFSLLAIGQREKAIEAFMGALRINPAEELDRALRSPKILDAFDDARGRLLALDHEPPKIVHEKIAETVEYNKAVEIQAQVTDNFRLKNARVYYRRGDEIQFDSDDLTNLGGNLWVFRIPGNAATGESIAYYIKATDEAGNAASEGSPSAPLTIFVAPSPMAKPWYTQWWVWGLIVVVVAGGAAGGVLAAQPGGQGKSQVGTAVVTF